MEDNVRRKSGGNNGVIIGVGSVALLGVLALTILAVTMFVAKINRNADMAYAETRDRYLKYLNDRTKPDPIEDTDTSVTITGYRSEDLVEIDGEWYIVASLVDSGSEGDCVPILVDKSNIITIDGNDYMHIENPQVIESDGMSFYGNEYIVVDIDGSIVYLVAKGDTLSQVSGRIGYSVQELAEFNDIKNVNLIYEGQTLRVPASDEIIDYVQSHNDDFPKITDKKLTDNQ